MIWILVAAQAAPLADMKSSMQPVSVDEGVALFDQFCFAKFPDSTAALAVLSDPKNGLVKAPKTPSQAMQPGDVWNSDRARVTYVDADWMPLNMGSPQCSVTILLSGPRLHSEIAAAMTSTLKLPPVKFGKDGRYAQTKWDVMQRNGDKWRLFMTSTQTPSGVEMRTVIMNLRSKSKKKK